MRPLILVILFFIVANTAMGQDLKKVKLSKEERDKGGQLILKDHLENCKGSYDPAKFCAGNTCSAIRC